ncbi:MAG: hypothetical protein ISF22_05575 [Methanomassiliicoccus sp.]|nr:hypothetical protein [Methanomassiliicoccus sp.]
MSCWIWFNSILEEAGVKITPENRDRIDDVLHGYIESRSQAGRCSAEPEVAAGQISTNPMMRSELISRVREAAAGANREAV